jgi:hypothetical protein
MRPTTIWTFIWRKIKPTSDFKGGRFSIAEFEIELIRPNLAIPLLDSVGSYTRNCIAVLGLIDVPKSFDSLLKKEGKLLKKTQNFTYRRCKKCKALRLGKFPDASKRRLYRQFAARPHSAHNND